MANNEFSSLMRGEYNRCRWCKLLDSTGKCTKTGRDVGYYMIVNKMPEDCIKRRYNHG
jgi:hypothetical protein